MELAEEYKEFLSNSKTERECVDYVVNEAEQKGYVELSRAVRENRKLSAGDKVYSVWMNKSMVLFEIGRMNFSELISIYTVTCKASNFAVPLNS